MERTWRKNPKINGAFYGAGPDVLKEEIEHTFGIPIDYYVLVDLEGFIALVDELGGVELDIPLDMNYDDPYQNLHIHFTKGVHKVDGQGAMEAVRYRHDNEDSPGGDAAAAADPTGQEGGVLELSHKGNRIYQDFPDLC